MILTILSFLLVINLVGFFNRQKAWSKVFLFGQLSVFLGLGVMFVLYDNTQGIQAKGKHKSDDKVIEQIKENLANENNSDTLEVEQTDKSQNLVRY
jgi:F0F1-type ATP synthase membrane subunit a